MALEPFFLAGGRGDLFGLYRAPPVGVPARGAVLYLHPFAEEMNRSRHCVARQAAALAAGGWAVLQIDLYGCGDSAGDFGEADWATWRDDALRAARWLQHKAGAALPFWFWGLRAGCLLASAVAAEWQGQASLLLWQPVLAGSMHLRQWLRTCLAADMLEGRSGGSTEALQRRLAEGSAVEVAGYRLSPQLADGLAAAELQLPSSVRRVICLEMGAPGGALSAGVTARLDAWRAAGHVVTAEVVEAPQFWQTPEIVDCPALWAATTRIMADQPA